MVSRAVNCETSQRFVDSSNSQRPQGKGGLTLYATAVKVALPCAGLCGTGHWTGMQVGSWERVQVPSAWHSTELRPTTVNPASHS